MIYTRHLFRCLNDALNLLKIYISKQVNKYYSKRLHDTPIYSLKHSLMNMHKHDHLNTNYRYIGEILHWLL